MDRKVLSTAIQVSEEVLVRLIADENIDGPTKSLLNSIERDLLPNLSDTKRIIETLVAKTNKLMENEVHLLAYDVRYEPKQLTRDGYTIIMYYSKK